MVKCMQCQTENSVSQTYCKKCNTHLLQEEGYTCPGCKVEIGPFAEQCRNCGLVVPRRLKQVAKTTSSPFDRIQGGVIEFRQPTIFYKVDMDETDKLLLIKHYQQLAKALKVSPKVYILPREITVQYSSHRMRHHQNSIQISYDENWLMYLIMQMRYVYLANYKTKQYDATFITNANEFINSKCEKDVVSFSEKYMIANALKEELLLMKARQKQHEDYLLKKIDAKTANIDESYIRMNPTYPSTKKKKVVKHVQTRKKKSSLVVYIIASVMVGLFIIGLFGRL